MTAVETGWPRGLTRRAWIAHCSALAASLTAGRAMAEIVPNRILVVGDSLSAEYGLARGSGWVALLDQRLKQQHIKANIVNASISGETTAGGRSRLPGLLQDFRPTHVIIELGGNDALRGLPLSTTKDNLLTMVSECKAAGAKVVLVGMRMPPNYGRKYGEDFAALYTAVARDQRAALVPFLLAGVADVPNADALFQPDHIHPRAEAHPRMLDNVWPALKPLLKT